MSEERAERCETCRFWDRQDRHIGECRRYPPCKLLGDLEAAIGNAPTAMHPVDRHRNQDWVWPSLNPDDWCGEWQPIGPVSVDFDALGLAGLGLSCRALNCLESGDIETIGQLRKCTARKLRQIRNLGKSTIDAIRKRLAEHGLYLLGENPDSTQHQ